MLRRRPVHGKPPTPASWCNAVLPKERQNYYRKTSNYLKIKFMKVYCPRCGQEQISPEIRFCSRCGFLMTGLAEVVLNGGVPQQLTATGAKLPTPRRRGLK